ncbi:autophagy-related protein 9A [Lingula anatina]|uniref:Autophagy-related protein 9 n=1 Tax=Lingula anatina TaxID=7574 RepID=A0A2R2MQC5_LINAN|nr:autophagy-related protein 9A [Lingula anatina]|eukprot:XP_023932449.1 autophagy-related protein 9A [Lingula anatina]
MSEFTTSYQPLPASGYEEDEVDTPHMETDVLIHVVPEESSKSRWNHIENLDEFFARVYQYHQRNGFFCMVLEDVLQLLQFVFVILFSSYLIECVKYDVVFDEIYRNNTHGHHKVTIAESVIPLDQCVSSVRPFVAICLLVAAVFWVLRLIKVVYNVLKYWEIRAFYLTALKISADELPNLTWHEVQKRVVEVQQEQQMCIHKKELTELDIYNRILRFKNYQVAMVNKSLLPLKYRIPFVGDYVFLSTGLKYNLEMILFWGPWAPFENYWHLKQDFKNYHKRKELADYLSRRLIIFSILNALLSPLIFVWQILTYFYTYAEIIKRQPGSLGARRWSLYGRLYLRHFNELDHEFEARLNRGYKPAEEYMNIFTSPVLVILAKNVVFFAGAVLAVLIILTLIDEDTLQVENILRMMTILGAVVAVCRAVIPAEHMVFCPEFLMTHILKEVHYIPDSWKGNAHTHKVRQEFAQLFQYKALYLLEELISPLVTPLILCFSIRHKAYDIVDFYRNFTVEVTGVGDVCSFAQMDIRKHGNPQWVKEEQTQADLYHQAEDGKAELSLMHFALTNPEWKPPENCSVFLNDIKDQAVNDANAAVVAPGDNALFTSLHTFSALSPGVYNSINISSVVPGPSGMASAHHSMRPLGTVPGPMSPPGGSHLRGAGVAHAEGPLQGSGKGILASLHSSGALSGSATGLGSGPTSLDTGHFLSSEVSQELSSAEMSFSALYIHELHRRRRQGQHRLEYLDFDGRPHVELQELGTRLTFDLDPMPGHGGVRGHMSNIVESPQEEKSEEEMSNEDAITFVSFDERVTKST